MSQCMLLAPFVIYTKRAYCVHSFFSLNHTSPTQQTSDCSNIHDHGLYTHTEISIRTFIHICQCVRLFLCFCFHFCVLLTSHQACELNALVLVRLSTIIKSTKTNSIFTRIYKRIFVFVLLAKKKKKNTFEISKSGMR